MSLQVLSILRFYVLNMIQVRGGFDKKKEDGGRAAVR